MMSLVVRVMRVDAEDLAAQYSAEAYGRAGTQQRRQHSAGDSARGHQQHKAARAHDIGNVLAEDAFVYDIRHQRRQVEVGHYLNEYEDYDRRDARGVRLEKFVDFKHKCSPSPVRT
jgi:hypothetical protein